MVTYTYWWACMDVPCDISREVTNTLKHAQRNIPYMLSNVFTWLYSCSVSLMDIPADTFHNAKDNHMDVKIDAMENNVCTVHALKQMRMPKMMSFLTFPTQSSTKSMSTVMQSHVAWQHRQRRALIRHASSMSLKMHILIPLRHTMVTLNVRRDVHTNNAMIYVFNTWHLMCLRLHQIPHTRCQERHLSKHHQMSAETLMCCWRHKKEHSFNPQTVKNLVDVACHVSPRTSST